MTRQSGVEFTDRFRQILGITQITDRQDLFNRYQEMIETLTRDPRRLHFSRNDEQRDQLLADRTAMLMLARAGYDLNAFPALFDRLAETKGKVGNWFTELVGSTNPDQKRLRELIKEREASPDSCPAARPPDPGFKQWQAQVASYSGMGHRERLHGVLLRRTLEPALRGDIRRLRFSPDGNYVLAQDYSSIWVLSRKPFQSLFRIDAPDAMLAHFTPDSSAVVFADNSDRVEHWSVPNGQRIGAFQLAIQKDCRNHELSPDGKLLACIYYHSENGTPTFGVVLFDAETGDIKFDRPKLFQPNATNLVLYLDVLERARNSLDLGFSPDGKYFVATSPDGPIAVELPTFAAIDLPHELRSLLRSAFVFLDPGRVAAHNLLDPKNSAIVTFPSGEVQQRLHLGDLLTAVTKGPFLIEGLQQGGRLGLLDLNKNSMLLSTKSDGLDVYNDIFLNERASGDIALYDVATTKTVLSATLPLGPLTSIHAFAVSSDESWLAVSERSRGAVWNLKTGERPLFVRGFTGGYFDQQNGLWANISAFNDQPRTIVRMSSTPPA